MSQDSTIAHSSLGNNSETPSWKKKKERKEKKKEMSVVCGGRVYRLTEGEYLPLCLARSLFSSVKLYSLARIVLTNFMLGLFLSVL